MQLPASQIAVPSCYRQCCCTNCQSKNPFVVWGDGSAIRDFIFAEDCAKGILKVFEKNPQEPVNLGSGTGISIKELVETLSDLMPQKLNVSWDVTKPAGDRIRILDTTRAKSLGFETTTALREGLQKTVAWYKEKNNSAGYRYNVFN